jgi:hypothetical protein
MSVPDVASSKAQGDQVRTALPGRRADPFDLPEWRALEAGLHAQVGPHLAEGDHLVFIEFEEYAGMPWHVAARARWSASYAVGWTSLLAPAPAPSGAEAETIGLALVPRFGESSAVVNALRRSAQRTRDFAAARGLRCAAALEEDCDREAFSAMLAEADIAKLLCHGFVDTNGEVALLLAHHGGLPLADSIAAGSPAGRMRRMSWRDCQRLQSAPCVVFSAACSSGAARLAGLGERFGLLGGLRHAGTRAIIAPRWDIVAADVLPIFNDVFEHYLNTQEPLARTLRAACLAAEVRCPRWIAWALALEGSRR